MYGIRDNKPAEAQNDGIRTPTGGNGESLLPFAQSLIVMAVPGADRRKSTDGCRTGRADRSAHGRRERGGVSAGPDPTGRQPVGGVGTPSAEPSVGDTGKRNLRILDQTAEAGDRFVPEPPAIEGVRGRAVVARRSDAGNERIPSVRSRSRRTRYLFAPSGTTSGRSSALGRRTTGTWRPGETATVASPRVRIRIPTVITK